MASSLLKQGGARLDGARASRQLAESQCNNLIEAAYIAWHIGQPFNRFITILWEQGGIDPRDNATVTGQFIKLAKDWARRHGYKMCWAWVQEHGAVNGVHIHILLHVPPELARQFAPMPLRWVKRLLPGAYRTKVLQSQRIGSAGMPKNASCQYEMLLMTKVHYMLKAAPKEVAQELQLQRHGKSSTVFGKRLAIWQGWESEQKRQSNADQ